MKAVKHLRRTFRFTLIELIVSMAVFALLGMMVAQLFSASQKLWVSTSQKNELSAEGNAALDLIANLLNNVSCAPQPYVQKLSSGSGEMPPVAEHELEEIKSGADYFELTDSDDGDTGGGFNAEGDPTSRLYMSTKTDHAGIQGKDTISTCFVGIQMIQIPSSTTDPDAGVDVLVMSVLNDAWRDFPIQFPENDYTAIKNKLNENLTAKKYDSSPIRIASNVVDFQVRAYTTADQISGSAANGSSTCTSLPAGVGIRLVLMDREHYLLHRKESDATKRAELRDRYGRTFQRVIWLGGDQKKDFFEDFQD